MESLVATSTDGPAAAGRLFVPLSDQPFRWFASGKKHWELRRYGRQYTPKHLVRGRRVELRRGYSDRTAALWGTLTDVATAGSVRKFFELDDIDYRHVIPDARTPQEAIARAEAILGAGSDSEQPVIGFQIDLDPAATLRLDPSYFELIRTGKKRSTVRAGARHVPLGVLSLVGGQQSERVLVTNVTSKTFDALTEEDARRDGFGDLLALKDALHRFYPDITDDKPVTIVEFKPVEP